jgi:hypothetical protein
MSLLRLVNNKVDDSKIKISAKEQMEFQIKAVVLDFIDEHGVDTLRKQINDFLENKND